MKSEFAKRSNPFKSMEVKMLHRKRSLEMKYKKERRGNKNAN